MYCVRFSLYNFLVSQFFYQITLPPLFWYIMASSVFSGQAAERSAKAVGLNTADFQTFFAARDIGETARQKMKKEEEEIEDRKFRAREKI